jgi:hypothetical protein
MQELGSLFLKKKGLAPYRFVTLLSPQILLFSPTLSRSPSLPNRGSLVPVTILALVLLLLWPCLTLTDFLALMAIEPSRSLREKH